MLGWLAEPFVRLTALDDDLVELPDERELEPFDPLLRVDWLRGRAGEDARVAITAG